MGSLGLPVMSRANSTGRWCPGVRSHSSLDVAVKAVLDVTFDGK